MSIKKPKLKWYTIKWKPKHKIKNRLIKVEAINKQVAKEFILKDLCEINRECFEPVVLKKGVKDEQ